jgi:hypothetical protein
VQKIVIFFWLQTAYSIWVFLRDAKFFRIPYAVISSLWHGKLFCSLPLSKQEYYVMVKGDERKDGGIGSQHWIDEDTCEEKPSGDFVTVILKKEKAFDGSSIRVLVRAGNILRYRTLIKKFYEYPICTREDHLVPGLVIMRRLDATEMTQKFIDGYSPRLKKKYAFIDNSSGERLNDNFMKMLSVIPIALQARGFDWPSVYVFFAIVLFDFFSYVPNNLWHLFKVFLFYSVKSLIAKLRNENTRVFLHDFLSTISENFAFCDKSRKCSYRLLGCRKVRACGEFLVPPYFTTISQYRPKRQVLALVDDAQLNYIEFFINSDRHEWRCQVMNDKSLNVFFFVNNIEFLRQKASMEELEAMYENMRDVEERHIYPITRATYWGIHVCSYAEFYRSLGTLNNICEVSLDPWVSDPFFVCGMNLAKMLHSQIAACWCKLSINWEQLASEQTGVSPMMPRS